MDAGSFKKYINERYGLELDDYVFEDKKGMVRVFSKQVMGSKIKGVRGFPAYDGATTHYFSTLFGSSAKNNTMKLDDDSANALFSENEISVDVPDGEYIGILNNKGCCTILAKDKKAKAYLPSLLKRRKN
ncbi:MAG: hypothetical protein NTY68_02760 [Candidatus Micrarchaeota archaeon]|nr:hypothetical protein [Candidatus Micrarchaeota archaeon]